MKTRWLGLLFALTTAWAVVAVSAEPAPAPPAKPEVPAADLQAQFAEFLKKPTEASFLAVQKLVTAHPSYSPYSTELNDVAELLEAGKFKEAQAKLAEAMPNLLLSPRAHLHAAAAAEKLGEGATAKKEREIAQKCIAGLLTTGDGTEKRPILVTRVSDEYDVVHSMKKRVSGQGLRQKEGRSFDVLQCSGGTQMWFDVTLPFGIMFKPKPPPEKKRP